MTHHSSINGCLSADETAIQDVILSETSTFSEGDFEGWKACWLPHESTHIVYVSENAGLCVLRGWTEACKHMQHVFETKLQCNNTHYDKYDMAISIDDNSAIVTFDSTATGAEGIFTDTYETRFMRKTPQGWKIAHSNVIVKVRKQSSVASLAVDRSGHVIWTNEATREKLTSHPVFSISSGRLRANRLAWDKVLQSALKNASLYHGHFEMTRFIEQNDGPFRCPVVLGETDEGCVAVVCLNVRDSATYVQFDLDDVVERKLAIAQTVFGLSEGQTNVARHVASGQGLKCIANELGISVNTVRTHLTRIYEKTGVNSQTALVRLLLSVA
ncbi:regulatory protein, luxR family [Octadecabacter temperatus]|uniref:LuxR family bacterial regulatory protein n=1 Tax=Octadecabacter temperatus TaxID=1458307 RepID=A0A0K0Y5J0_9RHOB|nr:helix-turn-helix transcriptional regulator [Octadecabacter temperatus]AKS46156.1 LuxR family bacterial regulatory protein [Octadecabacter temperatus]SIO08608.1 regulatory protein, luxR family [Octadecabacter temperatus]